ncbi:MAG: PilZ domain-containing protein [Nitrospira sp.]|nr:PilZ domain-containing protein [Nitrospira sp.]
MTPPEKDDKKALQPRGRHRVPVDYPAFFSGDEGSGDGTVTNLTIAGCEIRSHAQFPIGAGLSLRVQAPEARPPIIIDLAIVRWKNGDRFGLEFVRFGGRTKEQLEDMLNQREGPAED